MNHTVRLPHPDREGTTVGTCTCGWDFTYRWGGHGIAVEYAGDHIRDTEHAEPLEVGDLSGLRIVMPGRSL